MRVFHTSFSRWFFTGVWVTTSLLKSPGLLSANLFIHLMRFLGCSFVSCSFLVLLRYLFFILSFISACLMLPVSNIPKYLKVSFSPRILIFFLIWKFYFFRHLSFSAFLYYYYYYYYYSFLSFSHQLESMVSHGSLSDSKCPQVSRTLLSILADLCYAVVWMVSTRPLITKSSSPWISPLVSRAPITIGITVTFMFHSFYNSLARSRYYFSRFLSILLCGEPKQQSPSFSKFFFLLIITRSGRLAEIW